VGRDQPRRLRAFLDPDRENARISAIRTHHFAFDDELLSTGRRFRFSDELASPVLAEGVGEKLPFLQREAPVQEEDRFRSAVTVLKVEQVFRKRQPERL